MNKPRFGYMCETDYDHELGAALGGSVIFSSIEDLRRHRQCTEFRPFTTADGQDADYGGRCGIIKVEVNKVGTILQGIRYAEVKK